MMQLEKTTELLESVKIKLLELSEEENRWIKLLQFMRDVLCFCYLIPPDIALKADNESNKE